MIWYSTRISVGADEIDRGGQYHWCSECMAALHSQQTMADEKPSCACKVPKVLIIYRRISLRLGLARIFGRHLLCCRATGPGHHSPCGFDLYPRNVADCLTRMGRRRCVHLFQYRYVPQIANNRGYCHVCSCLRICGLHCRSLVRQDIE